MPAPTRSGTLRDRSAVQARGRQAVYVADAFAGAGITYSAVSSDPSVVSVSVSGALLTLVPGTMAGTATITVTATNADGTAQQTFTFTTVLAAPQVSGRIPAQTLTGIPSFSQTLDITTHFTGTVARYTATSTDSDIAGVFITAAGTLTLQAGDSEGVATVTVTASNASGHAVQTFAVTAQRPLAPRARGLIGDRTAIVNGPTQRVDTERTFRNFPTRYTAASDHLGRCSVAMDGSVLILTPGTMAGRCTVTVTASNSQGSATRTLGFDITAAAVPAANEAPRRIGQIADRQVNVNGQAFTVALDTFFVGTGITYSAVASTAVATAAVSGATLMVTPGSAAGTATITVTATTAGGTATDTFGVTVVPTAITFAPVGRIPDRAVATGEAIAIDVGPFFNETAGVTYAAQTSDTAVVAYSMNGSILRLFPGPQGTAAVTVTATNAGGQTAQQTFAFARTHALRVVNATAAERYTTPMILTVGTETFREGIDFTLEGDLKLSLGTYRENVRIRLNTHEVEEGDAESRFRRFSQAMGTARAMLTFDGEGGTDYDRFAVQIALGVSVGNVSANTLDTNRPRPVLHRGTPTSARVATFAHLDWPVPARPPNLATARAFAIQYPPTTTLSGLQVQGTRRSDGTRGPVDSVDMDTECRHMSDSVCILDTYRIGAWASLTLLSATLTQK